MSNEKGKNNNDLTTGDRLFDSGVGTDGTLAHDDSQPSDPQAKPIERNYSTYAANATAETAATTPDPVDPA